MKQALLLLLGILTGCALAAALLYFNPLTAGAGTRVDAPDRALRYAYPGPGTLAVTHRGGGPLPLEPAGVPRLWESTIRGTSLSVLLLAEREDESEAAPEAVPSAAATRISVPSAATELLRRGALVDDYWLVTVPGEGSFFLHNENNVWPLVKEAVLPVMLLDREWSGPAAYRPTVGPSPRRQGRLHGATGAFAGVEGRASETYRLERLHDDGRIGRLTGELVLKSLPVSIDTP